MNQYKTIFISDLHLGSKGCNSKLLNNFLKHNNSDVLYLVGDIVDIWKLKKGKWYWPQSHTNVVRKILGKAKNGTKVKYILGNHDESFRLWAKEYELTFGNIHILNQDEYVSVSGKRFLITHGDFFDGITRMNRWLYYLGDTAYDIVLYLNIKFNFIRSRIGLPYWSMSKWLKKNVKKALTFIVDFEKNISKYCKKKNFDGVICGHIHTPEIKNIDGVIYMNDGDFVESCSALVETHDGEFKLIFWEEYESSTDN